MRFSELEGIGPVTEKKLNSFDIMDTAQLLSHSPREVSDITGMDLDSAIDLFRKVRNKLKEDSENARKNGLEVEKDRKNVEKITTGTKALDKLFGGGVECEATTEIYGQFGCGKTQFCHTMAVRVQLPKEQGGLGGKCFWIDTERTFRPERIRDISESLGVDGDEILKNIIVDRATNSAEQYMILTELENDIKNENIRLIVIDSSTGLFRSDYPGRGNLANRQNKLGDFVKLASGISEQLNCAVVMTNQVMSDPGQMFGDPTKPIGGNIYGHSSTYRVYFKKSGKNRVGIMIDSPNEAEIEVMFALNKRGVVDTEVRDEDLKEEKKVTRSGRKKLTKDEKADQ